MLFDCIKEKKADMKQLFEIDLHDYDENDMVFRRPSARAIIFDDVGKRLYPVGIFRGNGTW